MESLRKLIRRFSSGNVDTSIIPPSTTTMEPDLGAVRSSGTEEGSGKQLEAQEHDDAQKTRVELGTPQRSNQSFSLPTSATQSRPVTRSMTRPQRANYTHAGPTTRLMGRLAGASSRAADGTTASNLEDAKDVKAIEARNRDDEGEEYMNTGPNKSRKIIVRLPTGSQDANSQAADRNAASKREDAKDIKSIEARNQDDETEEYRNTGPNKTRRVKVRLPTGSRDASQGGTPVGSSITAEPVTRPVRSKLSRPSKRQKCLAAEAPKLPLRRSARLSKPLTQFHKYPMLPPELKIMVFEALLSPRLVYVQNRAEQVRQPPPSWFMTNLISVAVAKACYKKMFAQDVNPSMDVVALEPCCGGCRGYHCASRNFSDEDRGATRSLAMQMEPSWLDTLPYVISPIWTTINMGWPNVETLYLMKGDLKGDAGEEKAMLRCQEGTREANLRSRFDHWRKTAGAETKMSRLEFVVVVPKESSRSASPLERYQGVEDRATGRPEDIIVG